MDRSKPIFPSVWQAVYLILALFFAEQVIGALIYDMRKTLSIDSDAISALTVLLANGCVFLMVMHRLKLSYREIFHPTQSSVAATALLLLPPVLLLTPALVLVMGVVDEVIVQIFPLSRWEELMFERMMSGGVASVTATCLLAPILEEMLFRGVILRGFLTQYTRWQSIVVSALLFGVAHLNLYQFVAAFLIGILLGWLYERTRSLVPCICLHAVYNITLTVVAVSQGKAVGPPDWLFSIFSWIPAIALAIVAAKYLRSLLGNRVQ